MCGVLCKECGDDTMDKRQEMARERDNSVKISVVRQIVATLLGVLSGLFVFCLAMTPIVLVGVTGGLTFDTSPATLLTLQVLSYSFAFLAAFVAGNWTKRIMCERFKTESPRQI